MTIRGAGVARTRLSKHPSPSGGGGGCDPHTLPGSCLGGGHELVGGTAITVAAMCGGQAKLGVAMITGGGGGSVLANLTLDGILGTDRSAAARSVCERLF